jgi:hypothetical protein
VKDRIAKRKAIWRRIGVAFPHDKGAGLTVILEALPTDGRIVLVEPRADPAQLPHLRPPPPTPPAVARDDAEDSS